jgi:histone acetyltransferase MYST1
MDEWIDSSRIEELPSIVNAIMKEKKRLMESHGTFNPETFEPLLKRRRSLGEDAGDEANPNTEDETAASNYLKTFNITTIHDNEHDEHEGMDENQLREHEEITKVKNIRNVIFGRHEIECWYYSPFPKEFYPDGPVDYLYFDEFSFRFFKHKEELVRFQQKSSNISTASSSTSSLSSTLNILRHPPGNEIYRDDDVSMFEVDGAVERFYCQNLSYFAKLFLDHKTLYYDVDPFLFYVLCTRDERGFHPVGYFSKEK